MLVIITSADSDLFALSCSSYWTLEQLILKVYTFAYKLF